MTISIWRYSHLMLAISSSLFIIIAAVTGIILAFEPISNQLEPFAIQELEKQSLAKTIAVLETTYDEVVELKIDDNHFVEASVITKNGDDKTFFINPFTGKEIVGKAEKKPIYRWATNLHRSLFLKSTGRIIVAVFSFLLALITITGSILIIKRQGGIRKLFSKIVKENTAQYYHIIFGRWTLIPILIITCTGVYLSLEKFSLLPETKITHNYESTVKSSTSKIVAKDFELFKTINLSDVKSLEYPFSEDEEDYFFLKTTRKEYLVHQYTGKIISNQDLSFVSILSNWSLILHTGRGTIVWSIILLLSCFAILFFIFSGFTISIKRKQKNNNFVKNKFHKDKAEFLILVGSETGSTYLFANALYKALLNAGKAVYIDSLNNFTNYNNLRHLIILTATYGDGEPPINAAHFFKKFKKYANDAPINYSIVGFGSLAYAKYCQFALDIDNTFKNYPNYTPLLPLKKINNQSFSDFKKWSLAYSQKINTELTVKQEVQKIKKQQTFTLVEKSPINKDDTYLVRFKPNKRVQFTSGDLLSIRPTEDNVERLYSIGKINNDILLSIKKHEYGVCSNLLFNLPTNGQLQAKISKNKGFHLPKRNRKIILIANGTGIAPFLGMLNDKTTNMHLFLGIRTNASLELYQPYLHKISSQHIHIAYSQEKERTYVQEILLDQKELIADVLSNKGVIMICGSIVMMKGVLKNLEKITLEQLNSPLKKFQHANQIKTDCY